MDHDWAVLSPEKAVLTFRLAGIGPRMGAHFLDLMFVFILSTLVAFGANLAIRRIDVGIATAVTLVATTAAPFLYFILFEGLWNGQTPGKRAASLRVRMQDGTPVTLAAAAARNLLRPADMVPLTYLVGLVAVFTNPRAQRIGDLVAGTLVVHEPRAGLLYAPSPHAAGVHPLEDRVGSLRGMTMPEYVALRRLADRFPELTPETQDRFVREFWDPFASRRGVPPAPDVHPIYLIEAVVMRYGRAHGLV